MGVSVDKKLNINSTYRKPAISWAVPKEAHVVLLGWAVEFHHGSSLTPPPQRGRKYDSKDSRFNIRMI